MTSFSVRLVLSKVSNELEPHWQGSRQIAYIHCLCTAYSLPMHCLFTAYALPIHCLFNAYSLPIHCLWTAYSLPIHCLFTAYSLPIHCLCITYALPMHCQPLFSTNSPLCSGGCRVVFLLDFIPLCKFHDIIQ
jgi:hypothetical protein